ncbi:transcriptional regulator with XRE-family HTH domain [Mucilaginibacter sp. UYP25]|uniref:helix-turn-helix domain-containing protein n=1 Tax=unclassified Mucilaginibacter TaxID=2617802 RepID=UPI0033914534
MLNVVNIKDVKLKAGELTKTLRKRENLSQEQLAEKLGLSRYTITNLESGQNATLDTLFKILQYFDMLEAFNGFIDNEINNRNQESLY